MALRSPDDHRSCREPAEARTARAAALVGQSRACPFDLVPCWFETQLTLGQDVFARGTSERVGTQIGAARQLVSSPFWASLVLVDNDAPAPDTTSRYSPVWEDLHSVVEARDRILRMLGEGGDSTMLDNLLQEAGEIGLLDGGPLRSSSAWATILCACLELTKQGDVVLAQADAFGEIEVVASSLNWSSASS